MALFSGGYLFVLSNYRQTTSFKNPHSHLYSKHLRSLNLDFAFHQKARISNTIESGNTKNCAAPVADMNGFQLRCHLQSDLPHDTVSKYQVLHTTPSLSSTPFSDSGGCNEPSLRVAHQGIRGAYSESAAEKAYPNCETIACQHFHSTFQAVARRVADRAVIPIENSLGGSIHGNYDLLLRHSLHIIGEIRFAVSHCLLANNGVDLHDLKTVLSHPQALAQCEKSLTKLGLEGEAVASTAVAAKKVAAEKLRDTGALASSSAALLYGLNILASNVQDDGNNVTRFLLLAREPLTPATDTPFKTSIVFTLKDGSSALPDALSVFISNQIKLIKIESRPLKNQPLHASKNNSKSNGYFNYLFYADVEASMADQTTQTALKHLKELSTFLRVLGSYPMV
ncbi:hypothetical protein ERO13_D09G102200v2 [Gossypium hirsutum]|uniref:arogenate dehydratase n=1 Tax=Gossypium hirsutum TaxID=3635 RepID=A0A1U8I0P5_GOSHI|nr:arogenate dehydratase/prephenate dehydratase 2, chloroplastic-like isoform X1 [Gossypium hirsutum]KAG4129783.1 hypothetical protein ERO13_D09G102200v2 [Gossypium hirsutum]